MACIKSKSHNQFIGDYLGVPLWVGLSRGFVLPVQLRLRQLPRQHRPFARAALTIPHAKCSGQNACSCLLHVLKGWAIGSGTPQLKPCSLALWRGVPQKAPTAVEQGTTARCP